ncbi:hypothetical protein Rhopal_005881-T1 [Rhodotorula paludigena]|uniref:SAC3/GANP/THP3 conserved domain-containing protein n=1 Tax=Rhodotorula paludigena TaxID=86838 RepID=A0AAV5GW77_9BASI|nr:hypothetical protein Rhopal_005881-T1 [Rhodotorula paludigena]
MQPWRGGPPRPSAFPSSSSSSNPGPTSSDSAPPPAFGAFAAFSERGRGRGRGTGRGAGRGAGAAGVKRHSNLSWRKPDEAATDEGSDAQSEQHEDDGSPQAGPVPAGSAFAAFGASAPFGGAFGSTPASAFGSAPSAFGASSATSAFGAGGASAFGAPAFGSSTPSTSSAFAPSSTAPTSSFPASASTAPAPAPLFRSASQQSADDASSSAAPKKRTEGQISTLEVLGEDSDARRKRFETSLSNNRYLELKPLREAQRLKAIKAGLIPDPSKPMRLDQATDFAGTCEDMCPEWEREEREYQNNVDPLERYPGTMRIDPSRAVKAFHRPAAGNDQPLPSDVRPPPILHSTLNYLFHTLLPTLPLATTHPFIRDRTRSIRQDFTVQNVRGASAIECNERIARYHILAVGTLREQSGFSESQELEQLRKVLKSLNEFYDDARMSGTAEPSPNEAEFRAYNILTHLRDPDIIWSAELLPPSIFAHPLFQRALALHRLAQRSNIPRGERLAPNAFSRFFKLVADAQTPYLFACILSTHFAEIRRGAIDALKGTFLQQHSAFPLRTLAKMLGCDGEDEAESLCEQWGLAVKTDERGKRVAEIHKQAVIKAVTLKPKVSMRLVEGKRGSTPYQAVIDGTAYATGAVETIPATPSLATSPTFAFSNAPAPAPRAPPAAPTTAAPFSFASRPGAVSGPSPLPTPFDSPAIGAATSTSLNATAPAFVPSFSLPSAATPAPPAPSPFATTTASAAPTFSFAPAPAASKSTTATSSAFSFTSSASVEPKRPPPPRRIPSASLRAAVTAAPFVPPTAAPPPLAPLVTTTHRPPSHSPKLARARGPSASPIVASASAAQNNPLRRVSLTRASPTLAAAPAHAVATSVTALAAAQRAALVEALSSALTDELVQEAVKGPVMRASVAAVKACWADVRAREAAEREEVVQRLRELTEEQLGRLCTREVLWRAVEEERGRRKWVEEWRIRTKRSRKRREEERERKRRWDEVVRGIEEEKALEVEEAEAAEDELVSDDEDDEMDGGLAGLGDAGLDFGGVSLGATTSAPKDPAADLVHRVKTAADTRARIWQRGTFLNILSQHVSSAIPTHALPFRPTWSTLISTSATTDPFAAWLACKFDLDASEGFAEVDAPEVDIEAKMLGKRDQPLASAEGHSLYRCAVLVILCPDRTLSPDEAGNLRAEVRKELELSQLVGAPASSVYLARFDGAEADFQSEAAKLVADVAIRSERIPRPLHAVLEPLLEAWRRSFTRAYKQAVDSSAASSLASAFLDELQGVITAAEAAASPAPRSRLKLLPLEERSGSFRFAVESYIAQDVFRSAGHFPDIATFLAQRPPISDLALARLLLEHLASFALTALAPLRTTQGALSTALPAALDSIETSLSRTEERVRPAPALAPPSTPSSKKRRASAVPPGVSSPKKQVVLDSDHAKEGAAAADRLSALEGLMKDARALLTRQA